MFKVINDDVLDWLNRIGIILNFLAGFMLAPQLIGEERIGKLEQYLDRLITLRTRKLLDYSDRNNKRYYLIFKRLITKIKYLYLIFSIALLNCLLVIMFLFDVNVDLDILINRFLYFFMSIIFFIFVSYAFLPTVIYDLIKKIDNLFEKENTIISLLTFCGIIFFIIGNLFQFIASFK